MEGGREGGEFSKSIQKWRGSYLSDIRVQKSQKLQNTPPSLAIKHDSGHIFIENIVNFK